MTVAVITINWNGWRNTLACIAALRAGQGAAWRMYLVDNASTDDSVNHLQGLGDDVVLIESPINGGWTGGNNLGLRAALSEGHDEFLILNNDAFVEIDTLAKLRAAFADAAGDPVLGAVHRGVEGGAYDFNTAALDPKTGIPAWSDAPLPDTGLIETAYIGGAALFAQRRHFETVGLLDDRFYLNFDDTDWCRRAAAAGFPLLMVRDAVIRHIGSASIGGRHSPLQTYFLTRNRLLFAEKHCTAVERLRLLRRCVWQARELTDDGAPGAWPGKLLGAPGGVVAAFRRGLTDYLLRRFGDCPPEVRRWQSEFAA